MPKSLLKCCWCDRYIAPLISKRIAADLRKRALIEGTFGSFVANEGVLFSDLLFVVNIFSLTVPMYRRMGSCLGHSKTAVYFEG